MSKNTHLEHLEDDIFNQGYAGAENSLNFLESLRDMLSTGCLLYTSPSPRDVEESRMPSSA